MVVIDLETSIKNRGESAIGKDKASPHSPENCIEWVGVRDSTGHLTVAGDEWRRDYSKVLDGENECDVLLVGHNIKFDLLYLLKEDSDIREWFKYGTVWDTQIVEYLLTGQETKYASLDELAVKYGGTVKDESLKDFWDNDVDTDLIPEEVIVPYLEGDLANTELIALAQYNVAERRGMLDLIFSQMAALKALTLMEYNGMCFDKHLAKEYEERYQREAEKYASEVGTIMLRSGMLFGNPHSTAQQKTCLFGGTHTYNMLEVVTDEHGNPVTYKTGKKAGQIKYKKVKKEVVVPALSKGAFDDVSEDTLNELASDLGRAGTLAKNILKMRHFSKQASTYFKGYADLVWPHDGCIHPTINQCATNTGRLSSSKPNLQNADTQSEIRNCFVSRYGDDGVLMEVDYSQLEIVVLAFLSGSRQLIRDIKDGIDLHSLNTADLYGVPYDAVRDAYLRGDPEWVSKRRLAKQLAFQMQYGAGAKSMAEKLGINKSTAKAFIDNFYKRYPRVQAWQDEIAYEVSAGRLPSDYRTKSGLPAGKSKIGSVTGRRYTFIEYDAPEWLAQDTAFSPTQMKNYPVQGFATGDIVPLMVGVLSERLHRKFDRVDLMVNTVHDSIVLDVPKNILDEVAHTVISTLNETPKHIKRTWGIDFNLPLEVELKTGPNWANMKTMEI